LPTNASVWNVAEASSVGLPIGDSSVGVCASTLAESYKNSCETEENWKSQSLVTDGDHAA
jgi:hypothetical protein